MFWKFKRFNIKLSSRILDKLSMTHCIAIHAYKGGTGKTTIAAKAAAPLVQMGKKVAILDLDVYAPSLHNYFKINPKKWINDFLDNNAGIYESVIDMTHLLFPIVRSIAHFKFEYCISTGI